MKPFLDDDYEKQVFRGIKMEKGRVENVTFVECSFTNCAFCEAVFRSCKFQDCVFKKCDLSLVKVDESIFTRTTFIDSRVIGVDWVAASWGKFDLHQPFKSIDFINCTLNYSTFMGLHLERILIKKCIARDVDFSDADLKLADLSFSDLTDSRFRHTDLSGANLRGAVNYFIQPQLNTLKKASFSLPEAMSLLYNLDIEIGEPGMEEKTVDDNSGISS